MTLIFDFVEVAAVLYRFMNIIKQEDSAKFEEEFQKLPVNTTCTFRARKRSSESVSSTNDSSESAEIGNCPGVPMELDSEWMVVKSRKRR